MWLCVSGRTGMPRIICQNARFPICQFLELDTTTSMVWWWNGGGTTHNTFFPHTILAPNVCDRSHHGRDCMNTPHTCWVCNIMTQTRTKTQDWVNLDKVYKSVPNLQHADKLEKNTDGLKAQQWIMIFNNTHVFTSKDTASSSTPCKTHIAHNVLRSIW